MIENNRRDFLELATIVAKRQVRISEGKEKISVLIKDITSLLLTVSCDIDKDMDEGKKEIYRRDMIAFIKLTTWGHFSLDLT